jgi:hypothetical protein
MSPGERGYLLTMGNAMAGTVSVGGVRKHVTDLVGDAPFAATPVGAGDWGVVDLDGDGALQLFFQVAPVTEQVAPRHKLDLEALLPAIAFSVLLHLFLLIATFAIDTGESPFVWPGARSMTGSFLATRINPPVTPKVEVSPTRVVAPAAQTPNPAPAQPETSPLPPRKKAVTDPGRDGESGPPGSEVGLNSRAARKLLRDMVGNAPDLTTWTGRGGGIGTTGPGDGDHGGRDDMGSTHGTETSGVGHKKQGTLDTKTGAHKKPGPGTGGGTIGDEIILPPDDDVEIQSTDPIDPREINKRIKSRRGLFFACYQRALNRNDKLGGVIKARFTIARDGVVTAVKIESSTVGDADVGSCVARQLRGITFPTSSDGAVVRYPFAFTGGSK